MKLYRATIELEIFIATDGPKPLHSDIREYLSDELSDSWFDADVSDVTDDLITKKPNPFNGEPQYGLRWDDNRHVYYDPDDVNLSDDITVANVRDTILAAIPEPTEEQRLRAAGEPEMF